MRNGKICLILRTKRMLLYINSGREVFNMIGEVLQRMRKIYGYKAIEMSEKLGISNSYLSEIENNKKKPSLELLEVYSNVFEIKVSSLILMSEKLEDSSNNNSDDFIRKTMIKMINFMSKDLDFDD